MGAKQLVPGVYEVSLGVVNAFLLADSDGLTLIDTGVAGSEDKILDAVREIGRQPQDIRNILVTHLHGDHTGSLAALKGATGAPATMHPLDAALVREGISARPMRPAPGLLPKLMVNLFMRSAPQGIQPTSIEYEVNDGDELPIAGGLRVFHAPGHAAGQVVFLWPQQGGVLFAADTAGNMMNRLSLGIVYEDLEQGIQTLQRIAGWSFDVACFGHGGAIVGGASEKFRKKWGNP